MAFYIKEVYKKNVYTALNVLEYYEKQLDKQLEFIFPDAGKAFDNVSWDFYQDSVGIHGVWTVHSICSFFSTDLNTC